MTKTTIENPFDGRINDLRMAVGWAQVAYFALAVFTLLLYIGSGYVIVRESQGLGNLLLVGLGILLSMSAAFAPFAVGKLSPMVINGPKIPTNYLDGDITQIQLDRYLTWLVRTTLTVGTVAYVGALFFSIANMVQQAEVLGFTQRIFGINSAYAISAGLEITQLFLLLGIIVLNGYIVLMESRRLEVQRKVVEEEIQVKQAEAELGKMRAEGQIQLQDLQNELSAAELQATQKREVAELTHQRRLDAVSELAQMEAESATKIQKAQIEAEEQRKLREIDLNVEMDLAAGDAPKVGRALDGAPLTLNGTSVRH